ncbi:hypothetical protein VQ643_06505 [Pseudomonas sp. F1_0610]|uniref:hypothetical protein n=1 Tax=Pseudomonas sp. F1_0610 TaxID=3114284 RepID=UPI0039C3A0A3
MRFLKSNFPFVAFVGLIIIESASLFFYAALGFCFSFAIGFILNMLTEQLLKPITNVLARRPNLIANFFLGFFHSFCFYLGSAVSAIALLIAFNEFITRKGFSLFYAVIALWVAVSVAISADFFRVQKQHISILSICCWAFILAIASTLLGNYKLLYDGYFIYQLTIEYFAGVISIHEMQAALIIIAGLFFISFCSGLGYMISGTPEQAHLNSYSSGVKAKKIKQPRKW